MRHIEFLGIPGAGKSTLCQNLVKLLQANGCDAYDIHEAVYRGLADQTSIPYVSLFPSVLTAPLDAEIERLWPQHY